MAAEKSILIFNSGPLWPVEGMNQVRILNQIKSLASHHKVDFYFLTTNKEKASQTVKLLQPFCNYVIPIKSITQSLPYKIMRKLFLNRLFSLLAYPADYFSSSNLFTSKKISRIVCRREYDVVISHYWQSSGFMRYLKNRILKCIDTHYLVEENIDLYEKGKYSHINNKRLDRLLQKELNIQKYIFTYADLLIVNSETQNKILSQNNKGCNSVCIPNGQDLEYYLAFSKEKTESEKNLLFYGSLSNQFNQNALKRTIHQIMPLIWAINPKINLIVMGANTPEWVIDYSKQCFNVKVKGFVNDVRSVFAECYACIIPMESGSGFRGRTIELMASGIPVIGTENALQSVGVVHNTHSLISESDEELAEYALMLAENKPFREKLSEAGKEFVQQKYTLNATFGKLSRYFEDYNHV